MKRVTAGSPIRVGEIHIIPVDEMTIRYARSGKGVLARVSKRPLGIVVQAPEGNRALDATGNEVSLGDFLEQCEELRSVLEDLEGAGESPGGSYHQSTGAGRADDP